MIAVVVVGSGDSLWFVVVWFVACFVIVCCFYCVIVSCWTLRAPAIGVA